MLGFDALCALPLADDAIDTEEAAQTIVASVSGSNRMDASQSGGVRPHADISGGTLIQVGF